MATKKAAASQHSKVLPVRPEHIQRAIDVLRKPGKAPKAPELGDKIDALFTARSARLALGRELDVLKKREDEAEEVVKAALSEQNLTGGKGTLASVTLIPKVVAKPDPTKWADIFSWIAKTKHWELLRKQLNSEPYRELLELKTKIPHTTSATVLDLSVKAL